MKIWIGSCGIGLGHMGRCLKIAEKLKEDNHEVILSTFGPAYSFAKRNGNGTAVINIPISNWFNVAERNIAYPRSITYFPKTFFGFLTSYKHFKKIISKKKPDIIISDTDIFSAFYSLSSDAELFLITNTLKPDIHFNYLQQEMKKKFLFSYGHIIKKLKNRLPLKNTLIQNIRKQLNRKSNLNERCKEVFCVDLPPPYTLVEHNKVEKLPIRASLKYIGLIVDNPKEINSKDEIMEKLNMNPDLPTIYIGISGPGHCRKFLIDFFTNLYKGCKDKNVILTVGEPERKMVKRYGNLLLFSWYDKREELLNVADIVVARAGLSTISEIVMYGKKNILIPLPGQPEQQENALSLYSKGLCAIMDQKDMNKSNFEFMLNDVLNDENMENTLNKYSKIAKKLNPLEIIASTIERRDLGSSDFLHRN